MSHSPATIHGKDAEQFNIYILITRKLEFKLKVMRNKYYTLPVKQEYN